MNSTKEFVWYLIGLMVSSPMNVLGLFLLAITVFILARAQTDKKNKIDLQYLLVDSSTQKITLAKFSGFGAFMASTWVFVMLPVTGKFDAAFASAYMVTWGAVKVAQDVIQSKGAG